MRTAAHRVYRRRVVAEPSLAQCVLLSLLLHIFLVLLVGTAERGGGRYGDGRAQDIDAALAPFMPDSGYRVSMPRRPETGEPTSGSTPAAAAPVRPSATPSRRETAPASAAEPVPPTPQPAESSPLQETAPNVDSLPRLDRGAAEIVDKAIEEPRLQELPLETIPRVDLEVPRNVEPGPAPAPSIVIPRETPAPAPRPAARPSPPAVEPEKAPVIETPAPAIEAPVAAPLKTEPEVPPSPEPEVKTAPVAPAPVVAPPSPVVAPTAPVITPPVVAPPLEAAPAPRAVETQPRSAPEAIAPAPAEAPPALAPPVTPPPVPATPAPRAERSTPRPLEPASTPAPAPAPQELAPATPRSVAPEAAPRSREVLPPQPSIAPSPEAPAAQGAPRLKFGAPEDADEIFKPRASPPTGVVPPPGQAPRLNLDTANKERAGPDIGRSSARKGILNLDPPPAEPVSKLGKAIQKASQPDCRDAYAAMGLLAVPFLLKDTVTDTGCRW
jgi:hypothetical protein